MLPVSGRLNSLRSSPKNTKTSPFNGVNGGPFNSTNIHWIEVQFSKLNSLMRKPSGGGGIVGFVGQLFCFLGVGEATCGHMMEG